jgi:LysR family hydrogen peroxide-inducible transcriptional activator
MSAQNLSFRDLQCIVAVAEHGSFSRAADACSITQPALSERVKRAETLLGAELFERNKRATCLTPAGEALLDKARELLDGADALDELIVAADAPLTGRLRVGFIATLGPYLVPHLLARLQQDYPALELVLQEGLTDKLLANLQAGALDLLLSAVPLSEPGIAQMPLFHEPFWLALPISHPLSARARLSAADLRGEDMVLLEDGHCLSDQALDICSASRRSNRNRLHATSLETLRHMVAAGAGYTLLPQLAVGDKPPLADLISYRRLDGKSNYGRTIGLSWRQTSSRARDASLLAQLIRDCLPEGIEVLAES